MNKDSKLIWKASIAFLSTFRSLTYDKIPVAFLLLRDFQKFLSANKRQLSLLEKSKVSLSCNIQKLCQPFLVSSKPNAKRRGLVLVRSEMFPITQGTTGKKFLFVAHHQKEFNRMRTIRACKPLVCLTNIPEYKPLRVHDKHLYFKLNKLLVSHNTPRIFKTIQFQKWLRTKVKYTLLQIRRAHYLFQKYPIAMTIYGSTVNQHGSLITTFAQSRGVFSVNIQHGLFGELGHLPVNADLNLVWGSSHLRYLTAFGAPLSKFRIIAPTFFRSNNSAQSNTVLGQGGSLYQKGDKLNIVVAMQPLSNSFNCRMVSDIESTISQLPNSIRVYYKLHPDQGSGAVYRKYLKSTQSQIIGHTQGALRSLIQKAHLIITPFSTVALEAVLQGKPVLFYGPQRHLYYMSSTPKFINQRGQLKSALTSFLKDPKSAKSFARYTHLRDLKQHLQSTQNVWQAIANYMQR